MGSRLSDHKVRVEFSRVLCDIGIEKLLFMDTASLALVKGDHHGDARVTGLLHEDIVEFVVVKSKHVHVQGDTCTGKDVLQDVVNVVTSHVEQVKVLACRVRVALLARVLLQFKRSEELTSELQSHLNLVCRLLLEKKKTTT